MSWFDTARLARIFAALALSGLTAGCFQPLYGDRSIGGGGTGLGHQLSAVDVAPIDAPSAPPIANPTGLTP